MSDFRKNRGHYFSKQRIDILGFKNRSRKLQFSMFTYLTHTNTIFEYCHTWMSLDNVVDII